MASLEKILRDNDAAAEIAAAAGRDAGEVASLLGEWFGDEGGGFVFYQDEESGDVVSRFIGIEGVPAPDAAKPVAPPGPRSRPSPLTGG